MKKTKIISLISGLALTLFLAIFLNQRNVENQNSVLTPQQAVPFEIVSVNGTGPGIGGVPNGFNTCGSPIPNPLEIPRIDVVAPWSLKQLNTVCEDQIMVFHALAEHHNDLPSGWHHYQWDISPNLQYVNGTGPFSHRIYVKFIGTGSDGFSVNLANVWCDGRASGTTTGGTVTDCGANPDI